jgi:hypothetical protein
LFGFASMGYIVFGTRSFNFHTPTWSWFTCLEIILGEFDLPEMMKADAAIAPFFFTFYMYLFYFLLLNIFIAILERSYGMIKLKKERANPEKLELCQSIFAF